MRRDAIARGDRRVRRGLRDHDEGENGDLQRPTLKVNEINVETFKGVVQLSGFVRSQADIDQTVKVARGVAGVQSVKNDMRIK
jgi:osmotically-inducible protein OsmY